MNFGQKLKSKRWDIYWTSKYLVFALVFSFCFSHMNSESGRRQENEFNLSNNDDYDCIII